MLSVKKHGMKLRTMISLLLMMTALCTTIVNWYSSFDALQTTLKENYLNSNYQYASKIATSTNDLFNTMTQNLSTLAQIMGHKEFTQEDLDEWMAANKNYFNSIFTTDDQGVIQLMSPSIVPNNKVKPGVKIVTDLMKKTLKERKPFISDPYLAQSGNFVLLISYPIFDSAGNYKGVVDGTIYLESESSLHKLIYDHMFLDGSTVFVVDKSGRIIYHPNINRIAESVSDHPLVKKLTEGNSGSAEIINSNGKEYFSGYAYVERIGWGIITQTPTSVMDEPLKKLTYNMLIKALPFLLLILIIVYILTNSLSKPLNILARFSEEAIKNNKTPDSINSLTMKSHIYEVTQLYQQIQRHFQLLSRQLNQDGLTGLANRRAFDLRLNQLLSQKQPFSLIMIDIDHFKDVNDNFGHLVGDDVLRYLADLMQKHLRGEDLCYRYGGEEFFIILNHKNAQEAYVFAEYLREKIAHTPSPTGNPITVSLGITDYKEGDIKAEDIIQRADYALYRSKQEGRNRTTVFK